MCPRPALAQSPRASRPPDARAAAPADAWNVLSSVFTMRFGGPTHCSTLLGLLDVLAFHVNIPFAFLAGFFIEDKNSPAVLGLVLGASIFAHVCMLAYLALDSRLDGAHQPVPAADSG